MKVKNMGINTTTGEYVRTHAHTHTPPTYLYPETYAQKFNRATDKH